MDTRLCPRAGFTVLTKRGQGTYVMPTVCKVWRCLACQKKLLSYFKMRVTYACLMGAPSYFITVTLRLTQGCEPADAKYVGVTWTRLLRLLRERWSSLWYVKVPEVTRRGQPHLHLLIGGIGSPKACCGLVVKGEHHHVFSVKWARKECDCLEHVVAGAWLDITGDSYRVQADPVYNASGAGQYLAKYFAKTFEDREELEQLGFKRRFSFSRGVPKLSRVQTAVAAAGGWDTVVRVRTPLDPGERGLLVGVSELRKPDMVGSRYAFQRRDDAIRKELVKKLGGNL